MSGRFIIFWIWWFLHHFLYFFNDLQKRKSLWKSSLQEEKHPAIWSKSIKSLSVFLLSISIDVAGQNSYWDWIQKNKQNYTDTSSSFSEDIFSRCVGDLTTSSVLKPYNYFHMKVYRVLLKRTELEYASWIISPEHWVEGKTKWSQLHFFSYPQISLYFSKQKRVVYFYRYLFYIKFSTNGTKMTLKNIKQSHVLQMEFSVLSSLKSEYFSLSLPTWQNLPANLVLRSEWKSPKIWLSEEIVLIFLQGHRNYILFIIFFLYTIWHIICSFRSVLVYCSHNCFTINTKLLPDKMKMSAKTSSE